MATESTATKGSEQAAKQPPPAVISDNPAQGIKEDAKIKDYSARLAKAEEITRHNVLWALGAGVLPIPVFDILAITGIELKMLKEFSNLYGVKFTEGAAKKLVVSLLSSLGSVGLGLIGGSLLKLIPTVGTALGVASVPVVAATATHALGKVFIMHFESGGTFLDFNPQAMRQYFHQEFEKAKDVIARLQKDEQDKKEQRPDKKEPGKKSESSLIV